MIQSPVQAVIFDFDYTLADSSRGVVECINFALAGLGLPPVSAEKACQTIGLSLVDTFVYLAGEGAAAQSDKLTRLFIERADEVMADLTVLFASVPQTIAALKERGLGLGIVSTKFRYRIESILRREGLLNSFDVIVGGEDVPNHKPDPEGLCLAMERLGCSPSDCVYVGDSVIDAETAARAGVPFVAVLSGVTPREAFAAHDVRQVLERVCDLPGWILHASTVVHPRSLLGVCGLYCGACYHYRASFPEGKHLLAEALRRGRPLEGFTCQGCRSATLYVHPGCAQCQIRACAEGKGILHCGACPEFPCDRLAAFQSDGRVHHRDVLSNLTDLQACGAAPWLAAQHRRWQCVCGAPFSWYEESCYRCGVPLASYGRDPTVA